MNDEFGAFMPDVDVRLSGAPDGQLSGTTFAAKDVFDICRVPDKQWKPEMARDTSRPHRNSAPRFRL